MMSKKGQEHVEMIIAFTIFISFVVFLFFMFNPLKSKPNEALVNNLYLTMKEELNTSLSTVSIKIIDSQTIPECFKINMPDLECKGSGGNRNIIVKDKVEGDVEAKADGTGTISIKSIPPSPVKTNVEPNDFFTLYCSDELIEKPFVEPVGVCVDFAEITDYALGIIVTRDLWSINKINDFAREYQRDYDTLKKQFVPPANDFKFDVTEGAESIFINEFEDLKPTKEIPKGVNIDSKNIPIDLLYEDATIKKGALNIIVW